MDIFKLDPLLKKTRDTFKLGLFFIGVFITLCMATGFHLNYKLSKKLTKLSKKAYSFSLTKQKRETPVENKLTTFLKKVIQSLPLKFHLQKIKIKSGQFNLAGYAPRACDFFNWLSKFQHDPKINTVIKNFSFNKGSFKLTFFS